VTACWTEPKSGRKDLQIKGFDFDLVSISPKYVPYRMWLLLHVVGAAAEDPHASM